MSVSVADSRKATNSRLNPWAILLSLGLAVILASLASLAFGVREVSFHNLWDVLVGVSSVPAEQIVILEMRLPRTIAALLVGSALAISGAVMQEITRNPLADPGLFGVNAGASFAIVLVIVGSRFAIGGTLIWPALTGALLATLLVYTLAQGRKRGFEGLSPVRMVLAGAAVSAFLLAAVRGILIASQQALEVYRHWVLGSFSQVTLEGLTVSWPLFLVGFVLCALLAKSLDAMALGEDLARSLGARVALVKLGSLAVVVVLCGASVALAGPIAFIGLLTPHIARLFSGANTRWLIVFSALFGALLLLLADIVGRIALEGQELQAGVTCALIGAPVFIYLFKQQKGRGA
ncbi:FecCD family ABC transporter permease [Polycladidibacter hongkongensis]|uniref:FecCD family ABC transporter permease n=1 Tax=Polycladidibacter hongkongensis TaxID=1647556 RepID=UPI000831DED6|nr:iron ABC transporter permease [Pseudovibrio hongkongensis]